jgi:hypothetical protein
MRYRHIFVALKNKGKLVKKRINPITFCFAHFNDYVLQALYIDRCRTPDSGSLNLKSFFAT